ncbi:hypothetical protein GCM10009648_23790 [Tsukamurella spumae]
MSARGAAVLASGAAVAWSNAALPRLARRYGWGRDARSAATLAFCLADAALARSAVPTVPGVAVGAVLAGGGLALVEPVAREAPSNRVKWAFVDIPLGTVLPEELLFRGALTPAWEAAFGRPAGSVAGPLTFGLWHVGAARAARDPIFPTIVVTSAFGAVLDAFARRTRRWWPGFVVHWALNAGGVILSSGSGISSPGRRNP